MMLSMYKWNPHLSRHNCTHGGAANFPERSRSEIIQWVPWQLEGASHVGQIRLTWPSGNFGIKPGTGNRVRLTGNRLEPEPAWTGTGLNRNRSVQYCTVLYCTGSFIRYKKNQKRNTNAGGAPSRGGFARPPRSCYVFDFFLHILDPVLAWTGILEGLPTWY